MRLDFLPYFLSKFQKFALHSKERYLRNGLMTVCSVLSTDAQESSKLIGNHVCGELRTQGSNP